MTQVLRDYQLIGIRAIREAFSKGHRSVLFVLPCGMGKTTIAAHFLMDLVNKGNRGLFQVHRRELTEQARARMEQHYIPFGTIESGFRMDLSKPVQIASIQSLIPHLFPKDPDIAPDPIEVDLIITDEGHRSEAPVYKRAKSAMPDALTLGITATPIRGDRKPLRGSFDVMIEVISVNDSIELGWLSDYRLFEGKYEAPDDGLAIKGDDFDAAEATLRIDTDVLVGEVYDNWKSRANGLRTIIFAQSQKHGLHLLDVFRAHGENFAYLDYRTPKDERKRVTAQLRSGELDGVINLNIYGEGLDIPEVECIVMARMTARLSIWIQYTMRGMRPMYASGVPLETPEQRLAAIAAGPKARGCIILDHGGNARHRFGGPDFPHEWSLDGKKRREDPVQPSLTTCPVCRAIVRSTTRVCKECGHVLVYVSKGPDVPDTTPGMLVEANYKIRGSERDEKKRAAELAKLEQEKKRSEREAKKMAKEAEVARRAQQLEIEKDFLVKMVDEAVRRNYSFRYPLARFRDRFKSAEKPKGFYPNHKHSVFIHYEKKWVKNKEEELELKSSIRGWTFNGKGFGDVPATK